MPRSTTRVKAACATLAILILAAGCTNQSPTAPSPSQDASSGVYATAGG